MKLPTQMVNLSNLQRLLSGRNIAINEAMFTGNTQYPSRHTDWKNELGGRKEEISCKSMSIYLSIHLSTEKLSIESHNA